MRRAIRGALRRYRRKLTLARQLSLAVQDTYQRTSSKKARNPVNKKRDKPPGDPKARMATLEEITLAQALFSQKLSI